MCLLYLQLGERTVINLTNSGVNVILDSVLSEYSQDLVIDQIKVFNN